MKIIHDDGINETLFLAIAWGLPTTCQIEGCNSRTSAILCFNDNDSPTGEAVNICICEDHYKEGVEKGKLSAKFVL